MLSFRLKSERGSDVRLQAAAEPRAEGYVNGELQARNQRPGRMRSGSPRPKVVLLALLLTACCLSFTVACRRDMQDQPKAIAYRGNSFYKDGAGSRPLVEGTVPRG